MPDWRVTATDAAKNFGGLIDQLRDAGGACVVERQGHPVVRIVRVDRTSCTMRDLARWLETRRLGDDAFADEVRTHVKERNTRRVPTNPWRR
jgi:antitoxin (DNA-binding transcriptional repressor) of toxin-antitoxin stability system